MKTQINHLVSGNKNQLLNPDKDYSIYPRATSHNGHVGSHKDDVLSVTDRIRIENPEKMTIQFLEHTIEMVANWSISRKSCTYMGLLPIEIAEQFFAIPKTGKPYICIHDATTIEMHNGKNAYKYVCPSLITIL